MVSPEAPILETLELEPAGPAKHAVIWLHGLGADGHDFEPVVPELGLEAGHGIRFVFPHAPSRAVTVNGGIRMPAWFDIRELDIAREPDLEGIAESTAALTRLIDRERERGIAAERIVAAGFSQGGVIALHAALRYPARLAGVLALSTYLPLGEALRGELSPDNRGLPIFIGHGLYDPVVPFALGASSGAALEELGYQVQMKSYAREHSVCAEEIQDIRDWLVAVLKQ